MSQSSYAPPPKIRLTVPFAGLAEDATWLQLTAMWVAVTAYNLWKPFHIDDVAQLMIAQWIAANPLHPMSGLVNWDGVTAPIWTLNHPALSFYAIAVWGSVFGYGEAALHALQAIPALICIALMHRIARHLVGPSATWATALLVLGPAFAVEQNLMIDVSLLAAWLGVFAPLICGVDRQDQARRYLVAAAACSAALLIKYSGLVLVVVLVASLVVERRWRHAWVLLLPLGTLAVWSAFNYADYGGVHVLHRLSDHPFNWLGPVRDAVAWVLCLGGLTPLGFLAAIQVRQRDLRHERALLIAAAVSGVGLVAAATSGLLSGSVTLSLLWFAFFVNGELALLAAAAGGILALRRSGWRRSSREASAPLLYLGLWIVGTSAFYVLFAPFVAPRHVLLILPPVILLFAMATRRSLSAQARAAALAATVIVSAGLGWSDWRFARFYEDAAVTARAMLPPGSVAWTAGHWGWQWYASRLGVRELEAAGPLPPAGDYVLEPAEGTTPNPALGAKLEQVAVVRSEPSANPFCVSQSFYSLHFLAPPWTVAPSCSRTVTIYKVN